MRGWVALASYVTSACFLGCGADGGESDGGGGSGGEREASDPCIRYCQHANKVEGCEHYADCEASCAARDTADGDYCTKARTAYYHCASKTELVCEHGIAVPSNGECNRQLASIAECEPCGSYCALADDAGCGSSDCLTNCEDAWAFHCGMKDLIECQADGGLACFAGERIATPACAHIAKDVPTCVANSDPCLGSCLGAELAGCPIAGRETCVASCMALLGGRCDLEHRQWLECASYGIVCKDGAPVANAECVNARAAYDSCVRGS